MACQMEASRTELIQVGIGNPEGDMIFHSSASRLDFKGYQAVYEDAYQGVLNGLNSQLVLFLTNRALACYENWPFSAGSSWTLKQLGPVKTPKEKLHIRIISRPCPN